MCREDSITGFGAILFQAPTEGLGMYPLANFHELKKNSNVHIEKTSVRVEGEYIYQHLELL